MEILVYLDEQDKKAIAQLVEGCKKSKAECEATKSAFWHGMIEKYPVLKNRRLALNAYDHYIFQPSGNRDLQKHSNLGQYYV